jgi:hypothetical protein
MQQLNLGIIQIERVNLSPLSQDTLKEEDDERVEECLSNPK